MTIIIKHCSFLHLFNNEIIAIKKKVFIYNNWKIAIVKGDEQYFNIKILYHNIIFCI